MCTGLRNKVFLVWRYMITKERRNNAGAALKDTIGFAHTRIALLHPAPVVCG